MRQIKSALDQVALLCGTFEMQQCKRNEELMCNREVATKDMVPTPATQGGHVPDIPLPDGTLISNDDDSFISDAKSEGGFGGANADDNGSEGAIPNE